MALCMNDIFSGCRSSARWWTICGRWRIASRETEKSRGCTIPSDTNAGKAIALATLPMLQASVPIFLAGTSLGGNPLTGTSLYQHAVALARQEWQTDDGP